ncbi:MAG: hypothetical protein K6G89_05205 [Clostridia bacterium]|nr:hypothetical protein [Clostridia bacterium]
MILLLLGVLSLTAIYATRLFSQKGMRAASIAVASFYAVIVAWVYFLFITDAASLGFNGTETWRSILIGSDVYKSFVDLTSAMSFLPSSILSSITYVSLIILISAILVIIHGTHAAIQDLIRYTHKVLNGSDHSIPKRVTLPQIINLKIPVLRLNCRMNC